MKPISGVRTKGLYKNLIALVYVLADSLNVDFAYQRTLAISLINSIVAEFSVFAFDPLLVGRRSDSSLWVVDGQTRLVVAKTIGMDEVPVRIFASEGKKHEAEVFLRANTKRSVKSFDKWRAALCAEEESTVAINDFVQRAGFTVAYSKSWPNLRCVSKLRDAYAAGVLPECLSIISHAWPNNPDALSEVIMGTLVAFFSHFKDADMTRCVQKWRSLAPCKLYADSESSKAATGGSRYKAGALVLLGQYNSGLRSARLDW